VATMLDRLGRFAYRRRGLVAAIWLAVLVLLGIGAVTLKGPMASTVSMPGTESQQALDLLQQRMPEASVGNASANAVFTSGGQARVTDAARATAIQRAVRRIAALPHVTSVTDPISAKTISLNRHTAIAHVVYDIPQKQVTDAQREALQKAGLTAQAAGLDVQFGGSAMYRFELSPYAEVAAIAIAAIILLVTFGSLIAAGMPLVTAGVGLAVGLLGIEIATHFAELQSATVTLAVMIGMAVGIDYCLFIVSRYRHELIVGRRGEEAAGRAVATAGSAVFFAGLTVVIALSALAVVGIPFLTTMGVAAAATVLATVIGALTLLPAVLGFVGERVLGRRGRAARDTEGDTGRQPLGERWARQVTRFRIPVLVVIVLALLACAVPVRDLRLGMTNDSNAPSGSTRHMAYDQISSAFGPGVNGPLAVAVDLKDAAGAKAAAATVRKDLGGLPGVLYVTQPTLNSAGDTVIITVIPVSGPSDQATTDLVKAIRARASTWQRATGARTLVTGETAMAIDVSSKLQGALIPYLAVIVGLAFILLVIMFRSLLVPLKAVVGFLLSVLATLGVVVAVFQWGWLHSVFGVSSTGPIIAFAPIFLVGILFGLAMDYEVFLVTRIREEHMRGDTANEAIVIGFRHGARVVVAAAAIMIAIFGGFAFGADPIIKTIGFAFAIGIIIDAFLVRMAFGPAVLSLLGERAWRLPRWLDRIIPNVDVEGLSLDEPDGEPGEGSAAPGDGSAARPVPGQTAR
jgi:putative drug exporter of the RND superfamily